LTVTHSFLQVLWQLVEQIGVDVEAALDLGAAEGASAVAATAEASLYVAAAVLATASTRRHMITCKRKIAWLHF
jgi:hypothetical protein